MSHILIYLRNNFSLPVNYRRLTHVVGGQITKYSCTTVKPESINIRICPATNVLISDNLPVRKSYFNSNIIARIRRPFFFYGLF